MSVGKSHRAKGPRDPVGTSGSPAGRGGGGGKAGTPDPVVVTPRGNTVVLPSTAAGVSHRDMGACLLLVGSRDPGVPYMRVFSFQFYSYFISRV